MSNENNKKKLEKIIELYKETNLPKRGWIQGCMNCETKTSRIFTFKKIEKPNIVYIFNVYICKDCSRENILQDEKFIKYVNRKIRNKFSYLLIQDHMSLE